MTFVQFANQVLTSLQHIAMKLDRNHESYKMTQVALDALNKANTDLIAAVNAQTELLNTMGQQLGTLQQQLKDALAAAAAAGQPDQATQDAINVVASGMETLATTVNAAVAAANGTAPSGS